ncbi:MAG TPA: hypothetical protein DCZ74_06460 [Treponema sp.]|nr:hypothetical protein [Treponema sp.]
MKRFLLAAVLVSGVFLSCGEKNKDRAVAFSSVDVHEEATLAFEPSELEIFRKAYPDVVFESSFVSEKEDFLVHVKVEGREADFYWSKSRFLPGQELPNAKDFAPLLYAYPVHTPDPEFFSEQDVISIKEYASEENRKNGVRTPMFLYNLIYESDKRGPLETHIVKTEFLGKRVNVHERISQALLRVEKKILELAETDPEVKSFVTELDHAEGYAWRSIRDNENWSFHALGTAVDLIPRGVKNKNVYWAWRRDKDPENWMLLPLERRWMPPEKVTLIFESEGFIWGGKWLIWDTIHYEYHPELLLYS